MVASLSLKMIGSLSDVVGTRTLSLWFGCNAGRLRVLSSCIDLCWRWTRDDGRERRHLRSNRPTFSVPPPYAHASRARTCVAGAIATGGGCRARCVDRRVATRVRRASSLVSRRGESAGSRKTTESNSKRLQVLPESRATCARLNLSLSLRTHPHAFGST